MSTNDRRGRETPDEAARGGSARHGTNSGSGSNEPKGHERKEQKGFVPRQGGDETRTGGQEPRQDDGGGDDR